MSLRICSGAGGAQIGIQLATSPLAPFKFITHITRAKASLPIRGGLPRIAICCYLLRHCCCQCCNPASHDGLNDLCRRANL